MEDYNIFLLFLIIPILGIILIIVFYIIIPILGEIWDLIKSLFRK